jgi:hypothetical protein
MNHTLNQREHNAAYAEGIKDSRLTAAVHLLTSQASTWVAHSNDSPCTAEQQKQ